MFSHFEGNNGRTLCGRIIHRRIPVVDAINQVTCKVCDRVIAAASCNVVTGRVAHVITRRAGNVAAVHVELLARLKGDASALRNYPEYRWMASDKVPMKLTWRYGPELAEDLEALIKLVEERL